MRSIEITDRSEMIAKLEHALVLNPRATAVVTIDMHRGHLDMDVATMPTTPEDARRVIAGARSPFITTARAIFIRTGFTGFWGMTESSRRSFWRAGAMRLQSTAALSWRLV